MARTISPSLQFADHALEMWARWGRSQYLGWPAVTILARVIEQGFTGAAQRGPTEEMSELVRVTERAVLKLPREQREAVLRYYNKWETVALSARATMTAPDVFARRLHMARRRIADYLECYRDFYPENSCHIPAA